MAKIAMVCVRDGARAPEFVRAMTRFVRALRPDHIDAPHEVATDGAGLVLGVFNPAEPEARRGTSAYAGWVVERDRWPEAGVRPTGSYALFRDAGDTLEVLADAVASRTIWYVQTPDLFVAATSQRAIPWFLGSFDADRGAIAWQLSAGCLGYGRSWDARAKPLGPGGALRFDRRRWQLHVDEPPVHLEPAPLSRAEHRARLSMVLDESVGALAPDWSRWRLALSGGNDCRAILQRLRRRDGLECVTWGLAASQSQPGTDAVVARDLAARFGARHTFYPTDLGPEPTEVVLQRFLHNGEGRVDHLAGYMDGFRLWKSMYDAGIRGMVRGDHVLGGKPVSALEDVIPLVAMHRWEDWSNRPPLHDLGMDLPTLLHPMLQHREGESAASWRDRLVQSYKLPAMVAALNDLKASYVEIANPLVAAPIVEVARSLPDDLRTDKKLFRSLTDRSIPFASSAAIASPEEIVAMPDLRTLLQDELGSARTARNFTPAYARWLGEALGAPPPPAPKPPGMLRSFARSMVPREVRQALSPPRPKRTLSAGRLALRTWIVNAMLERLAADAREGVAAEARGGARPDEPRGAPGISGSAPGSTPGSRPASPRPTADDRRRSRAARP